MRWSRSAFGDIVLTFIEKKGLYMLKCKVVKTGNVLRCIYKQIKSELKRTDVV